MISGVLMLKTGLVLPALSWGGEAKQKNTPAHSICPFQNSGISCITLPGRYCKFLFNRVVIGYKKSPPPFASVTKRRGVLIIVATHFALGLLLYVRRRFIG